jgi:hypothetical protein
VPATVKFCSAQVAIHFSTVLFGLPAMVVVKIRPLALSLQSLNQMNISTRYSRPNGNLHPASVVSPASGKATENRENGDRSSTTAFTASSVLGWQTSASEVVDIQPVRATTKLCTIAGTGHVTVGGISRTTTVNNFRSTN